MPVIVGKSRAVLLTQRPIPARQPSQSEKKVRK
jgi:hypothetical protein